MPNACPSIPAAPAAPAHPATSAISAPDAAGSPLPVIHWTEQDKAHSAAWRPERDAAPPARVAVVDDTLAADVAYRLACEGNALLWRGDFHNARQLLQAMARRADRTPQRKQRRQAAHPPAPAAAFHRHRQLQAQRARVLGSLLIVIEADHGIALRRAPDVRPALAQAWGVPDAACGASVVSLRELLGISSAFEWRRKGVVVPALGGAAGGRIHPHYGVFSPLRGEYVDLVAGASLPAALQGRGASLAFDIGTGSGVLAAVLAHRGVQRVVATDLDPRALACAKDNLQRLGLSGQVQLRQADLFPDGTAALVVCNPPWLPARPSAPIERAIYDEDSRMLRGFLAGLAAHLAPGGEGWLILSDLAEHLELRTRAELLALFAQGGLRVVDRLDARPRHPKALDADDPLHSARAAEVTSLWRLAAMTLTPEETNPHVRPSA